MMLAAYFQFLLIDCLVKTDNEIGMRLRRNILAPPVRVALLTLRCDRASSPDPGLVGMLPTPKVNQVKG